MATSIGGKPTIQVHPMLVDVAVAPKTRPPVPRKPDRLLQLSASNTSINKDQNVDTTTKASSPVVTKFVFASLRQHQQNSIRAADEKKVENETKSVDVYGDRSRSNSLLNLQDQLNRDDISPDDLEQLEAKRQQLIASLSRKLVVLEDEHAAVIDELHMNERIGQSVYEAAIESGACESLQSRLALNMQVC
jgi:hypothetical protein